MAAERPFGPLWLVYPRSTVPAPKTRLFMDLLIERLGARPDWTDDPPRGPSDGGGGGGGGGGLIAPPAPRDRR